MRLTLIWAHATPIAGCPVGGTASQVPVPGSRVLSMVPAPCRQRHDANRHKRLGGAPVCASPGAVNPMLVPFRYARALRIIAIVLGAIAQLIVVVIG